MPHRTVTLSGGDVEVHGLTMAQVYKATGKSWSAQAIAHACDVTVDEANEWIESTPAGDVKLILEAITELSGLDEGAQFPKRQADVPGDARETV